MVLFSMRFFSVQCLQENARDKPVETFQLSLLTSANYNLKKRCLRDTMSVKII